MSMLHEHVGSRRGLQLISVSVVIRVTPSDPCTCQATAILLLGMSRSVLLAVVLCTVCYVVNCVNHDHLLSKNLQVDKINSQVASRLVSCFTSWRQLDSERQAMMKKELTRIVETKGLSDNVFEIASKALE